MSDVLECYSGYYIEKDQAAVCGIILSNGERKIPFLKIKPDGDYLNGLLELIIEQITPLKERTEDWKLHVDVHIHHKNKNFNLALDKVIKSANAARCYKGEFRANVIKHTLTRKDYKKPVSYEKMTELANLLAEINDPYYRVTITTSRDSRSLDQLAVYTGCQGKWNDLQTPSR